MFRVAFDNNIDEYTDTVTTFIRKCIGDVVPTVNIKTYPNQNVEHKRKTECQDLARVVPGFWSLDAPIVLFDLLFSLDPHYYLHLCLVSPDCI
jgi:hypothetical protein